jgi:hypothetical protein
MTGARPRDQRYKGGASIFVIVTSHPPLSLSLSLSLSFCHAVAARQRGCAKRSGETRVETGRLIGRDRIRGGRIKG